MYFFLEQASELNKQISELAERTNYDTNQIWVDAQVAIQEKYNLPAFHIWEHGYCQGDASDDEVFAAKDSINEVEAGDSSAVYAEWNDDDSEILTDVYEFLDRQLLKQVDVEILRQKKRRWIEFYEEDIREFLKENYFTSGGPIMVDYSVYIDIESGEIWDKTEASSNWQFEYDDDNRRLVLHMHNYDNPFSDHTDLIGEGDNRMIQDNLDLHIPEDWEELEYIERVEWVEKNAGDNVKHYNERQRDEAIETIVNLIEDEHF